MAKRKPDPEPRNEEAETKVDLFIAPYQEQYSDALSKAREAEATTSSAGWQTVYRNNCEQHRNVTDTNARWIIFLCESIAETDSNDVLGILMRAASEAEHENPLLDGGLAAAVQARIADWPRAFWDEENGAVSVARSVLAS